MAPGPWQTVLVISGSISHVALMMDIGFIIFCVAVIALANRPKKRGARRVKPVYRTVDYSAARAKAIEWLGDRYLLAKPVNRTYQPDLPAMLRRQAN